jgi:hypothetical protein
MSENLRKHMEIRQWSERKCTGKASFIEEALGCSIIVASFCYQAHGE